MNDLGSWLKSREYTRSSKRPKEGYALLKMQEPKVRAHTLRWATTLSKKDTIELRALALSNPALMQEWIEELTCCGEQCKRESEFFEKVINELESARRPLVREGACP